MIDEKILIIEGNSLLRKYLKERLEVLGFEIIAIANGFDGLIKMRNEAPSLVIMDHLLTKVSCHEFLKEKKKFKTTVNIPVIIISKKILKEEIDSLRKFKIYKFMSKPINIDDFFNTISKLFNLKIKIDKTPCMIDVHLNEDVLFVEIAEGLNIEKINILRYKFLEIMQIYDILIPKILFIFTNLIATTDLTIKLKHLFELTTSTLRIPSDAITVLTNIEEVKFFLENYTEYKEIYLAEDFLSAIEHFGKIDDFTYKGEIEDKKIALISSSEEQKKETENEAIALEFISDKLLPNEYEEGGQKNTYRIAIIDDDFAILEFLEEALSITGWDVFTYTNGQEFIDDYQENRPDIIFLDLMMPEMNGFQVMEILNNNKEHIPIIVITALTQREMIIRSKKLGAASYIPKPLHPKFLIKKVHEVLNSNF